MFVLWLSDYICNWFSSSVQLVRSFPCSTWHRELLYRQLQVTCFILALDCSCVLWRDQQVPLHIGVVFWYLQGYMRNLEPFFLRQRFIYVIYLHFKQELKEFIKDKGDNVISHPEQWQTRECWYLGGSPGSISTAPLKSISAPYTASLAFSLRRTSGSRLSCRSVSWLFI